MWKLRFQGIAAHEQRCIHYAPSFLVASLFTVCHHLGWIPAVLLRLNHRQGVAEPFVLNDGRVADTLTHTCFGAGVRTSQSPVGILGRRACVRRAGCFKRGTLNADRKANRKGAALFNGLPR
jgi:hypothetical protein